MLVFASLSFPFAVVTIRSRAIALVRRVSSLKETVRRRSAPVDVTEAEKIVYPNLALAAWNTCSGEVLARHFLGRLRLRLHGRREVGRGGGVKLSLSLSLSLSVSLPSQKRIRPLVRTSNRPTPAKSAREIACRFGGGVRQ